MKKTVIDFHTDEFYGRLAKEQPKSNLKVNAQMFDNIEKIYKELNPLFNKKETETQLAHLNNTKNLSSESLNKYFETCSINKNDFLESELSPRQALILMSEVFIKPIYGDDFFGVYTAAKLEKGVNIITDGGFMEEIIPMLKDKDVEIKLTTIMSHGFGKEKTEEFKNFNGDSRNYFKLFLIAYLSQSNTPNDIKKVKYLKDSVKDIIKQSDIDKIIIENKQYIKSPDFSDKLNLFKKIKTTQILNDEGQLSLKETSKLLISKFKLDQIMNAPQNIKQKQNYLEI